jgi:hypothetical protein
MDQWYDGNKLGNVELMRFILSGVNRKDLVQNQINYSSHKRRAVELVYDQRFLESVVSSTGRIQCETFSKDGETSQVYELDPDAGVRAGFSIEMQDLETRCANDQDYFYKEIKKAMDVCVRKLETNAAVAVLANGGKFAYDFILNGSVGTAAAKTGASLTSGGAISTDMLGVIRQNIMANEYPEAYIFGGFIWDRYAAALQASTGNTTLGTDYTAFRGISGIGGMTYSQKIQENASNDSDAVAIMPGAVQWIHFNEFVGDLSVINQGTLVQGTLLYPDPQLPILFDYRAEYSCTADSGTRTWNVQVGVINDFIFLPDDLYQTGDTMEGVNGINLFRIVNP